MEKNKTSKKLRTATYIIWTLIILGFVGLSFFLVFVRAMLSAMPSFDETKFVNKESTRIYDSNDELIAEIGYTIRKNVTYDDLPTSLVDAFVACEDSRFFEHGGFDPSRFLKATIDNVLNVVGIGNGGNLSGGSTISMQLVKNTYFTDDASGAVASRSGLSGIKRKFQEIKLATELEKHLDKETILELYVNKLNYGANGRGIQNAANYYFGKNVQDLTLSESALLVGTINSPYYYNPFSYPEHAQTRRDEVLYLMYYHGYISSEEYKLARTIDVIDQVSDPSRETGEIGDGNPYQAYIDAVINEAQELTGESPYAVTMKIHTAMDPIVQTVADEIQAGNTQGRFEYPDELVEVASVAIDNDTGDIIAILGGRNYAKGGSRLLNHATQQFKQPGSSIKTIVEYPLCIEYLGWNSMHPVFDEPYTYAGTDLRVANYDGQYYNLISLQEAIERSLNAPALRAMDSLMEDDEVGRNKIIEYMNSIGYDQVNSSNFNVQYAIGGSTLEVSVVQQAAAQAMIMNKGVYIQPHTIKKIEFMEGDQKEFKPIYKHVQALSEETCYIISTLLNNNVNHGYSYAYPTIRNSKYKVYAKSGTSNWGGEGTAYGIPAGSAKDCWVNAATGDYAVCTWAGYEKAIPGENTYMSVKKRTLDMPGNITRLLFNAIEESHGEPQNEIKKPDGVVSMSFVAGTYPYVAPVDDLETWTGLVRKSKMKLQTVEGYEAWSYRVGRTVFDEEFGYYDEEGNWHEYAEEGFPEEQAQEW